MSALSMLVYPHAKYTTADSGEALDLLFVEHLGMYLYLPPKYLLIPDVKPLNTAIGLETGSLPRSTINDIVEIGMGNIMIFGSTDHC